MRRALLPVLLVLSGLGLLVGVVALWLDNTLYDSNMFSRRVVSVLDSQAVRSEVADRFTEHLVQSGNQLAISYRPAMETAIETALDTETFRSVIRVAVRTLHADVLRGDEGDGGVNLADSVSILAASLQLPSDARGAPVDSGGFSNAFADTTTQLSRWGIWNLDERMQVIGGIAFGVAVGAAAAAIAVAANRRRAAWWLGWVVATVGLVIVALLWIGQWYVSRRFVDGELAAAVSGGLSDVTVDLRTWGLWILAYGVVIAGAAGSLVQLQTPAVVGRRVGRWLDDRRSSTAGTVLIGVLGVVVGLLIVQNLGEASILLAVVAGLWLTYLGTAELLRLLRRVTAEGPARRSWWQPLLVGAAVLVVLGGLVVGLFVTTRGSAADAVASAEVGCNGSEDLCDRRLDEVLFAGTHNSMSSALYPGWLFGEQIGTIQSQLDSGIRALLFDTHYGIPSRSRMPGARVPIVLSDRSRELDRPEFEQEDPSVRDRATALEARASTTATADSSIYLCHNYCALGAVSFASVLDGIGDFVDTHPNDVVIIVIQDATTPADTAQAFIDAGLEEHIVTLDLSAPLPTLQDLIDAGTTLVVFAEDGGGGSAPPWYQPAYQGWVQETPYSWSSVDAFDCSPNRGGTQGPLFLVNHWVTTRGPEPATAARANADDVVRNRLERCVRERGEMVNIIAADFSQASSLVDLVAELNQTLIDEVPDEASPPSSTTPITAPPDTAPPSSTTPPSTPVVPLDDVTIVTTLTGGDPGAFCSTIDDTVAAVTAYAEAVLSEPTATVGRSDLAYAPLLVRTLTPYLVAAPSELFELADPLRQRAEQAARVLDGLGIDEDERDALAEQAAAALGSTTDGATVQVTLLDAIGATVEQSDLDAAVEQLGALTPDPATIVDLGYVSPEVASASGFNC